MGEVEDALPCTCSGQFTSVSTAAAISHADRWSLCPNHGNLIVARFPSREDIDRIAAEIRLLTKDEMRELFPDAEIIHERFPGITKSIIAYRR